MKHVFFFLFLMTGIHMAHAENELPPAVTAQAGQSLTPVGHATYRKFGFRIYDAVLWAHDATYNPSKPYALDLRYNRDLSKDTVTSSVIDSLRDENVADEEKLTRWSQLLDAKMPAIEDGDTLTGLSVPGKASVLFHNGRVIATLDDPAFSNAFFAIWLAEDADMHAALTKQTLTY